MLPCDWCKKIGHAWFDCSDPSRPSDWRPARLTKSTAARMDVPIEVESQKAQSPVHDEKQQPQTAAGTQAPPVDTLAKAEAAAAHLAPKRGKGRPKSIADMRAYKAEKARQRRAAEKAARGPA